MSETLQGFTAELEKALQREIIQFESNRQGYFRTIPPKFQALP